MSSEKSKTVNASERSQNKKMFFNETEDEYQESKIVLPASLEHPSRQDSNKAEYGVGSRQIKKSSKNQKSQQSFRAQYKNQPNPHPVPSSPIPSISVGYQNLLNDSQKQADQDSHDYEGQSEQFSLSLGGEDLKNLINVNYRLFWLVTVVENYSDELHDEGIVLEELMLDLGKQRFLAMHFHIKTIEKCTDQQNYFDLYEYQMLINEEQHLRQFLLYDYPNLEVDEQEELFKYQAMTDQQYQDEYFEKFDQQTRELLFSYLSQFDDLYSQYDIDYFDPLNYNPFKPSRTKPQGPLDNHIKNTNYFQNIDKFNNTNSKQTIPKNPPKPNKPFQVSIRKDKTNPQPSKTNSQVSKSNPINLFNIQPISITNKTSRNDQVNKNPNQQITFQKFLSLFQNDQNNKQTKQKIPVHPAENKSSHFDKILGRQSDSKSQVYLKPFVGDFSKKEDPRQKEFLNQISQSIDNFKNVFANSSAIQYPNKNETQKLQVENKNPFEPQGTFSYLSQASKEETNRNLNQMTVPNFSSNNHKSELNTNNPAISQQAPTPSFNNVFSATSPNNLSMSPPSFSNLSRAQSPNKNPFDPNNRLSNNSQKGSIFNTFAPPQNPQPLNQNKPESNSNNFAANSITQSQNPFSKNLSNTTPQKTSVQSSPFSKSQSDPQSITPPGQKTPQTPKFGGLATSEADSHSMSNSDKNIPTVKNLFEAPNKAAGNLNQAKSQSINGIIQKEQKNAVGQRSPLMQNGLPNGTQNNSSTSFQNNLQLKSNTSPNNFQSQSSNLSNNFQLQPNTNQNNLSIGVNGQPNVSIQNQGNFQGPNNMSQNSTGLFNSFSNNVRNPITLLPPIATNAQVLNPLNPSVPEVACTNLLNPKNSNEIVNKEKRINTTKNQSQMKPEDQHEENKPLGNKNQGQTKNDQINQVSKSKFPYTDQQIMNMKVSDFLNGLCRSQMDSLYKDLFEQLLITKTFKNTYYVPVKSLKSKILSLEQSLLNNSSPNNRHRQLTKRTMFRKLKNKQLEENTLMNCSPFQMMNQINEKLLTALKSSLAIPVFSVEFPSNTRSDPSERFSVLYREVSPEEDLNQIQQIQDTITSQLQDLEQKLESSILQKNPAANQEHIYLTLNEELVSMISVIQNTEKWLVQNNFCSTPLENACLSSESKLKIENKAQNETEDFKILKTVYKNLNIIETNVSLMSQVLSSI